jgi:predicted nucleotidyltransferase
MTKEDKRQLLHRIKELLEAAYGDRLQGVILYGSEARGEAEPDSDLDFLAILEGPFDYGEELWKIIHVLYPLQLEVLRPLDVMPVERKVFEAGEYAVYRNAQAEGIRA